MISVSILGAGNVASHLFKAFSNTEQVSVNQWYNRSLKSIQPYKNDVAICDSLSELTEADIYILAVSDDAIAELSNQLPFDRRLVVHTSGCLHFWLSPLPSHFISPIPNIRLTKFVVFFSCFVPYS